MEELYAIRLLDAIEDLFQFELYGEIIYLMDDVLKNRHRDDEYTYKKVMMFIAEADYLAEMRHRDRLRYLVSKRHA